MRGRAAIRTFADTVSRARRGHRGALYLVNAVLSQPNQEETMKKTLKERKLTLTRDTLRQLTDVDSSKAIGGVLCSRCDTTCVTCKCTNTARCTSG